MKYLLADESAINLRDIDDAEDRHAQYLARRSLDVCPTCGGRWKREHGMDVWGSEGYSYRGEHHDCDCRLQKALFVRYLLANIGNQYMQLDWADFSGDAGAAQWIGDYVDHWTSFAKHGFGLTFASTQQGVGKTWAATHIGKEVIKRGHRVYFMDFVEMVDAFCDNQERKTIERHMRRNSLLIVDDVRAGISERQTDLYALTFEVVIRHRTNFNLPTIFTTNLTEAEFEAEFPRIYSLIAPKQMWIDMKGVDHRKMSETAIETTEMILRGEVRPIT